MEEDLKNKLITESIWLGGLLLTSAVVEYVIIIVLDLHPVMSVKIQGLIGLLIIGYLIRMVARLSKVNKVREVDKIDND